MEELRAERNKSAAGSSKENIVENDSDEDDDEEKNKKSARKLNDNDENEDESEEDEDQEDEEDDDLIGPSLDFQDTITEESVLKFFIFF